MRVMVSAAEPSGDRLAAELLVALRQSGPVEAYGLAGPALRAAGVAPLARMEDVSVMGVVEVLRRLGPLRRAQAALRGGLARSPDALIVVDAPDLHLPLAARARQMGIPAIGYVSPQVWAWRPGRVDRIAAGIDALLCLLSFEPGLFAEAAARSGCDVRWVGHPVLDRVPHRSTVDPLHVGLLPGSRPQELRAHQALFLEAFASLQARWPAARATLVRPPSAPPCPALPPGVTVADDIAALTTCRAALTKSGTATVELAAMGVPMVVAHRVPRLTHWLGRRLVRGVSHVAMPNVLAGRAVVPEVLQGLDPDDLADRLAALPERQVVDLSALGAPGASMRAAAAVRAVVARQRR
jgi:lipid-A-disaccharide synthase